MIGMQMLATFWLFSAAHVCFARDQRGGRGCACRRRFFMAFAAVAAGVRGKRALRLSHGFRTGAFNQDRVRLCNTVVRMIRKGAQRAGRRGSV